MQLYLFVSCPVLAEIDILFLQHHPHQLPQFLRARALAFLNSGDLHKPNEENMNRAIHARDTAAYAMWFFSEFASKTKHCFCTLWAL